MHGLAVPVQQRPQLLPRGEGDGLLLGNRDRRAGLGIFDHARGTAALGEGSESRVGQAGALGPADAGADEVVTHLDEDRVHDLGDRLLRQVARQVLTRIDTLDELRLRHSSLQARPDIRPDGCARLRI